MKVAISIIVLASIFILIKLSKRGKAELTNHPLTAISKNGFLGFMLGDRIKFVWSRINHLGLMTQEEFDDFKRDAEIMEMVGGVGFNSLDIAKNKYEEIHKICLGFDKEERLNSIMVYVKDKPNTPANEYMKELSDKYVGLLGKPNAVNRSDAYGWAFRGSSVVLFNMDGKIILHIHNKHSV